MVNVTINGQKIQVPEGTTIMEAADQVGIKIPHLCFLKNINDIGACRVCVVEVEGTEKLATACNTECVEGMVINTNSERARKARKINVELILSDHNANCPHCLKSGNCTLQSLAPFLVQDEKKAAYFGIAGCALLLFGLYIWNQPPNFDGPPPQRDEMRTDM